MCTTCGCGDEAGISVTLLGGAVARSEGTKDHGHGVDHAHHVHAESGDDQARSVLLEQHILSKNDALASENRRWLANQGILAVNLMSSPGSGKTTLLERTIREMGDELAVSVIEGDQETPLDAERIRAAGRPVAQVNTGAGCHLDAQMVRRALDVLAPGPETTVFIENVGNLVCPALFDLGEGQRVVVASVTEGADKPLKYPHMFRSAALVVVNKVDLLPYVDFEVAAFTAAVRLVNPQVEVVTVSATTGEGLEGWYSWIQARSRVTAARRPS